MTDLSEVIAAARDVDDRGLKPTVSMVWAPADGEQSRDLLVVMVLAGEEHLFSFQVLDARLMVDASKRSAA